MSLTARPEVISLAGGLPATDCFPAELLEEIGARIARTQCALSLQYGPTEGFDVLKLDVAHVMAEEWTQIDPQRVIITTGGQQAIDLVAKAFLDPGDVVLAESPAYPGALTTFLSYQADVVHVPMDEDGIIPEGVEETLDRLAVHGRRPKFLYVVPNFSNPSGVSLSLERRRRLVDLAAERDLLLVEDNPYGLLRFEGGIPPTLLSLDRAGSVVYVGSFSKIISPGIRTGYVVAPTAVYQKLVLGKQAADLCSSTLNQLFVHEFVASGMWKDYISRLRSLYVSRRDTLLRALKKEFPEGAEWTHPQGGFFVWATLPGGIHTGDLLVKAIDENVAFVRGDAFFVDGQGTASMRLSFSYMKEELIEEGVKRLGRVIRDQLELSRALGF
ncbi:MAG: PLP-dependent aminotransferase family protein [Actinobacteria bacterium]|nr:PLP-dependent aminotransferase family protein [Actinomycetota bacterium]